MKTLSEGELKKRLLRELQLYNSDTEIHFKLSAVTIWIDECRRELLSGFIITMPGKDIQISDVLSYPASGLKSDKLYKILVIKEEIFDKWFGK